MLKFSEAGTSLAFSFATPSRSEVTVELLPTHWHHRAPVYLPTHELLTIYPGFVPLYETRDVEFEETWRDTCLLLGAPALRGPRRKAVVSLLEPLEEQLGGRVVLERNGRFYLAPTSGGSMEMPLVAEGWRKVAMLARLIATGDTLAGLAAASANANCRDERALAGRALQRLRWRVALHLEQRDARSRLWRRESRVANVLSNVRTKVKAVDAHPVVLDRATRRSDIPWTARRMSSSSRRGG